MSEWKKMAIGSAIDFNPAESIKKGITAKKIPMGSLTEFQRKINSYELSEYSSGPKFRNGDTLVAKITPCIENGKTAFVDVLEENEVAFGSSEFIVLRKTNQTNSEFIYYLAISPTFRNRAISCMEGTSGRQRVNERTLKSFELFFPPIQEQTQIAKVLSDLDAKIELNNKINTELEAMAKLIYDYWFVQFEFPDKNGKPYKSSGGKMVWNEDLKREVPAGWKDGTFGDYNKSTGGFAFKSSWWSNNGLKVVKIKDIQENNSINLNDLSFANISSDKIGDKFLAKPGNVLIAMTGATVGKFAIVPITEEPLYVNQRVGFFNLGDNPLEKLPFLINSLNQQYFREAIFTLASGAAQPNISNEQINNIQLLIPEKSILENYNKKFKSIYKKILLNQFQNIRHTELRDWLLPMLMNGQVKVETRGEYKMNEKMNMAAEAKVRYE